MLNASFGDPETGVACVVLEKVYGLILSESLQQPKIVRVLQNALQRTLLSVKDRLAIRPPLSDAGAVRCLPILLQCPYFMKGSLQVRSRGSLCQSPTSPASHSTRYSVVCALAGDAVAAGPVFCHRTPFGAAEGNLRAVVVAFPFRPIWVAFSAGALPQHRSTAENAGAARWRRARPGGELSIPF